MIYIPWYRNLTDGTGSLDPPDFPVLIKDVSVNMHADGEGADIEVSFKRPGISEPDIVAGDPLAIPPNRIQEVDGAHDCD